MRTVRLRERVARECRLAPADVAILLAEHRAHVEVMPTGRRGRYRLTPTSHVGTIVCPTCRLVIRPKIPLLNLFHLLDPDGPLPVIEDHTTPTSGHEALDFLAARMAQLLGERAAAGLHRAYTERTEQGPFLQGRLDVAAQLRDSNSRKDQFHCRYEDFTLDVPCNQLPKATAELALRSPLLGETARMALRRALQPFGGVSAIALASDSFTAAALDRLTEPYRPLLDVCRLLADGLTPGANAGATPCPAFLLNLERVFEHYVAQGLVRTFAGSGRWNVAVQPLYRANQVVAGQPDIQLRPDVAIDRAGRLLLVVDTKWKRLLGSPLVTDDLYQVLAYGTALGVPRVVLVYPGRRNRVWKYPLERAPLMVEVRTLQVVGPREACIRSLRALGRRLR